MLLHVCKSTLLHTLLAQMLWSQETRATRECSCSTRWRICITTLLHIWLSTLLHTLLAQIVTWRLERRESAAVPHVGEFIFLHYYTFDFLHYHTLYLRRYCNVGRLERRASAAVLHTRKSISLYYYTFDCLQYYTLYSCRLWRQETRATSACSGTTCCRIYISTLLHIWHSTLLLTLLAQIVTSGDSSDERVQLYLHECLLSRAKVHN